MSNKSSNIFFFLSAWSRGQSSTMLDICRRGFSISILIFVDWNCHYPRRQYGKMATNLAVEILVVASRAATDSQAGSSPISELIQSGREYTCSSVNGCHTRESPSAVTCTSGEIQVASPSKGHRSRHKPTSVNLLFIILQNWAILTTSFFFFKLINSKNFNTLGFLHLCKLVLI